MFAIITTFHANAPTSNPQKLLQGRTAPQLPATRRMLQLPMSKIYAGLPLIDRHCLQVRKNQTYSGLSCGAGLGSFCESYKTAYVRTKFPPSLPIRRDGGIWRFQLQHLACGCGRAFNDGT